MYYSILLWLKYFDYASILIKKALIVYMYSAMSQMNLQRCWKWKAKHPIELMAPAACFLSRP